MMFNLFGFITTVSVTANTRCMTDILALVCLVQYRLPGLVYWRMQTAINGLPIHAVGRDLFSVVQAGTND